MGFSAQQVSRLGQTEGEICLFFTLSSLTASDRGGRTLICTGSHASSWSKTNGDQDRLVKHQQTETYSWRLRQAYIDQYIDLPGSRGKLTVMKIVRWQGHAYSDWCTIPTDERLK